MFKEQHPSLSSGLYIHSMFLYTKWKKKKKGNMYSLLTTDTHNLIQTGLCSGVMSELESHTQYSVNTQQYLLCKKGYHQSKCSQMSHYGGRHPPAGRASLWFSLRYFTRTRLRPAFPQTMHPLQPSEWDAWLSSLLVNHAGHPALLAGVVST